MAHRQWCRLLAASGSGLHHRKVIGKLRGVPWSSCGDLRGVREGEKDSASETKRDGVLTGADTKTDDGGTRLWEDSGARAREGGKGSMVPGGEVFIEGRG